MNNDKNPGQRNMEEEETGEADRREESERERVEAERRARQGSPQPGGKNAPPWSDRDSGRSTGGSPRGPNGGKRF